MTRPAIRYACMSIKLPIWKAALLKAGDNVELKASESHARSIVHLTAVGKLNTLGSNIVERDLLNINGEFCTVQDTDFYEVRLNVDKTSHVGETFRVDDKVEAYVTDKGHVRYLYHLADMTPVQ